jgi:AcrR family transcriptional regulator
MLTSFTVNDVNMKSQQGTERARTADRILEAAEELLAERGYDALSMRAIGARVGVSQAAIYRHFADKAALVETIVARGYRRILATLEGVAAKGGPADEGLAEAMRAYVELSLESPALFKAVLLQPLGPALEGTEVLAEGVRASGRKSMALLVGQLERGMDSGVFARADPELSAQALWAAIYGLAARLVLEGIPPGKRRDALVARQIEILVKGLKA